MLPPDVGSFGRVHEPCGVPNIPIKLCWPSAFVGPILGHVVTILPESHLKEMVPAVEALQIFLRKSACESLVLADLGRLLLCGAQSLAEARF